MALWMKAESNDFRQKNLETNWKELESIQQTADRFGVSYSFVCDRTLSGMGRWEKWIPNLMEEEICPNLTLH